MWTTQTAPSVLAVVGEAPERPHDAGAVRLFPLVMANGAENRPQRVLMDTQSPQPSNSGTEAAGEQDASLVGVSCPAIAACAAIGGHDDMTGTYQGLIDVYGMGSGAPPHQPFPSRH